MLGKPKPDEEVSAPLQPEPKPAPLPSAAPLENVSKADIIYAQETLKRVGFDAGITDGIWGPRSANAIRDFENKFGLVTADGFLSELNLFMLEKISNTSRNQTQAAPINPVIVGITSKLDQTTPLSDGPQLVFLDQTETMLAKPNPFSERVAQLPPGTGIYVISNQDGWYEVESEDKQRGFIKAD